MARSHGLGLVDDACQAHGSRLLQRPVGSYGDVACFSFYPGKNLGAFGEGGAVVTNDPSIAQRLRQLRDHAQVGHHHHVEIGFNYRMEGLQGAVLAVKLEHLDSWNAARCRAADRYFSKLSDLANLRLPRLSTHGQSNWHLFVKGAIAASGDRGSCPLPSAHSPPAGIFAPGLRSRGVSACRGVRPHLSVPAYFSRDHSRATGRSRTRTRPFSQGLPSDRGI
jgi:hypothetical protein